MSRFAALRRGRSGPVSRSLARARVFGRHGLRTVLAWQVGRLVARLALAAALAITFGRMIEFGTVAMPAVTVALVALALSAAAGLFGDLRLASAESAVAQGTRDDLRAKLEAMEARAVHERPAGALIARVEPNSPAARAGLKQGDVVMAVDGAPVRNSSDLRNRIGLVRVGEAVELTYRRGEAERSAKVKVAALPTPERN